MVGVYGGSKECAWRAENDFEDYIASRYNRPSMSAAAGTQENLGLDDYRAQAQFRYHIRRFLHFSEDAVAQAGLEKGHYQCLLAIKGVAAGTKPSVGELARQMHVRHHSAVELADRLEVKGLVRRERDPADKRRVLLVLTPKGEPVRRWHAMQ